MKIFQLICLLVCCACAAVGCSHKATATDNLALADRSFSEGAYDTAQKICDGLSANQQAISDLSTDERCRLALLYLKLAEQCHEQENTAAALECYRSAMTDAPAEVTEAFAAVPVEDMQYVVILSNLLMSQSKDSVDVCVGETDSLVTDTCFIDK